MPPCYTGWQQRQGGVFMTRVRETIMRQDFPALFKRFFLAAVAVVILGGAAVGLSLQKQIVELGGHLRERRSVLLQMRETSGGRQIIGQTG